MASHAVGDAAKTLSQLARLLRMAQRNTLGYRNSQRMPCTTCVRSDALRRAPLVGARGARKGRKVIAPTQGADTDPRAHLGTWEVPLPPPGGKGGFRAGLMLLVDGLEDGFDGL